MEGKGRRATLARVVVVCAAAGAMVAWSPAGTDGSPGTAGGTGARRWQRVTELRPPTDASWTLGSTVAMQDGLLAVGPAHDWDLGEDRGGVRLFGREGLCWNACGQILHPAGDPHAHFGASLAIDGPLLAVGSPRDGVHGFQAGATFVYARRGDRWVPQASLHRPRPMAGDLSGSAVAMQGRTLAMGVPKADEGGLDTGAVEVFEQHDDAWVHVTTLTPPTPQVGSFFGIAVAVDGPCLFVGAPGDDTDGPISGRVHVFRKGSRGWAWEGSIGCPTGPRGWFGASVAASQGVAVAGAPRALRPQQQASVGGARGAAWTLARRNGTWSCQHALVPADPAQGESLGCAAATDGRTILLGATADSVTGDLSGAAFAFQRPAGGAWQGQRLEITDAAPRSLVGHGLAVDGAWLAVGRLGDPEADPAPGQVNLLRMSGAISTPSSSPTPTVNGLQP